MGSKGKNSTFSEHGHVAYQITGNHECSNMVAKSLPTDAPIPYPPLTLGMGSVGQIQPFQNRVMLQYQNKENHECNNMVANIIPQTPCLPSVPGDGLSRSKFIFTEHGHVAYQVKGNQEMQLHSSKYFAHRPPHPTPTLGWGE